jgi:hypothetical protein
MKTLIVYYSKSGNTRAVAEKVYSALSCDMEEIKYDEKAHTVSGRLNPAAYGRVILMCPIWAFHLPEPMTLYLRQFKDGIRNYRLVVTCGRMGLRGCVSGCKKILGVAPEMAMKIRAKQIPDNQYSIADIVKE